jgi:hypothetical protein
LVEVHGRVTPRRVGVWLLAAGLALMLAMLGYRVWRVWRAAWPLLERVDTVQALAADPAAVNPALVGPMLQQTHAELVMLRDEARPFLTLASHLGWVPGVGADMQALPSLLDTAVDLTGAGKVVIEELEPLLHMTSADQVAEVGDPLSQAMRTLADARPQLETARTLVERAAQRRAEIDVARLSSRLARLVKVLDRALPLAQAGIEAALMAPDLLGNSGPRTYLLLAQNSDELRPTGGFITGAGRVTVDAGDIVEFSFSDSYTVDDFGKPYDEPPAPLYEYMLSELWLFRDTNWSPDFPTSARKAIELYTYGQGVELDGAIAFDQQGAAQLIGALGPFTVEGWDDPVTGKSFVGMVRQAWNPGTEGVTREWARTRKDFLGALAQVVLQRVKQQPETVNWFGLGQALWHMLEERHLLIYMEEPTAASWLHEQGWDGALRPADGDYLMAVDANLGFNKVNPHVVQMLEYQVTLHADGGGTAALEVNYRHVGHGSNVVCSQRGIYEEGERVTYESLMEGCYWNYLRVYAPEGSRLWVASPHPVPADYLLRGRGTAGQAEVLPDELGKAVFAQFFVVEYGQGLTTHFEYDLPPVARPSEGRWRYQLLIQKQPGTEGTPVSLAVVLPPGAELLTAKPFPHAVDGETLTFELQLDADIDVEIVYMPSS